MRDTVFCASAGGRGAPGFSGDVGNGRRMEARQGAIRVFSGTPFPPQRPAAHHSGFIRCAIPRTVATARTSAGPPRHSREPRLRQIAHQVFVEAGSGALAARGRRRAGDEDGGIGISPKMRMAPCRASIPLPFPTRPHTRGATPACRRALTPFHCIAGHLAPGERGFPATRSAKNQKRPGLIRNPKIRHA